MWSLNFEQPGVRQSYQINPNIVHSNLSYSPQSDKLGSQRKKNYEQENSNQKPITLKKLNNKQKDPEFTDINQMHEDQKERENNPDDDFEEFKPNIRESKKKQ